MVISDLKNGHFIESLRNSNKEHFLKPIAYKNIGTEAIYDPKMGRIDSKYLEFRKTIKELEEQRRKE